VTSSPELAVGVTWLGEDDVMGIDVGVVSMETVDERSDRTELGDESDAAVSCENDG
jgi:hypothetical protein